MAGLPLQPAGRAGGILQVRWAGDGAGTCDGLHSQMNKAPCLLDALGLGCCCVSFGKASFAAATSHCRTLPPGQWCRVRYLPPCRTRRNGVLSPHCRRPAGVITHWQTASLECWPPHSLRRRPLAWRSRASTSQLSRWVSGHGMGWYNGCESVRVSQLEGTWAPSALMPVAALLASHACGGDCPPGYRNPL